MPLTRDDRPVRARFGRAVRGFSAMEAHVETCSDCQDILERFAADSSGAWIVGPERLPAPEQPPTIPGFVIERELGRGGMGVVYQAWQPQLARRVAIKVVSASVGIGADDRTALAARGAGDRAGPPSQRRPAPRSGRTRRLSLPRPRPDRRGKPGGPRHRPLAGTCRGRVDGGGRAGRRPDPQGGDVASRHQALEHLARRPARRSLGSGHADARRLRDRPGGRRPGRDGDRSDRSAGYPFVHGARNRLPATAPRSVRDPTSSPSGQRCTAS